MKKCFFFAIVVLMLTTSLYSQKIDSPNSISISAGLAMPVGAFGKNDLFNRHSGFASSGPAVSVLYTRKLTERFHLSFEALGQFNATDKKGTEEAFGNVYFSNMMLYSANMTPPPGSGPWVRYQNWGFAKESWSTASFLVGAQYDFPLSKTADRAIYTRGSIGAMYANAATLEGASISDNGTAAVYWNRGSGWGPAFALATGIRYGITKKLYFTGGLSVNSGSVKFKDAFREMRFTQGQPGMPGYTVQESTFRSSSNIKVSNLNIMLGIGTRF